MSRQYARSSQLCVVNETKQLSTDAQLKPQLAKRVCFWGGNQLAAHTTKVLFFCSSCCVVSTFQEGPKLYSSNPVRSTTGMLRPSKRWSSDRTGTVKTVGTVGTAGMWSQIDLTYDLSLNGSVNRSLGTLLGVLATQFVRSGSFTHARLVKVCWRNEPPVRTWQRCGTHVLFFSPLMLCAELWLDILKGKTLR